MGTPVANKPFVGAHTSLATFDRCPKQFHHRYILRDQPYVESVEMKWGNVVHSAMEHRVGALKTPLAPELARFEKYALALEPFGEVKTELKLGLTEAGEPVDFFASNVAFRGVVDTLAVSGDTAFIADWKTGRKWEDPRELEEHGMLVRATFAHVTTVKAAYVWMKADEIGKTYDVSDAAPTFARVVNTLKKINSMTRDSAAFNPLPNKLCPWCPVKACAYNPKKD